MGVSGGQEVVCKTWIHWFLRFVWICVTSLQLIDFWDLFNSVDLNHLAHTCKWARYECSYMHWMPPHPHPRSSLSWLSVMTGILTFCERLLYFCSNLTWLFMPDIKVMCLSDLAGGGKTLNYRVLRESRVLFSVWGGGASSESIWKGMSLNLIVY